MWSSAVVTLLVAVAACVSCWEHSFEAEGQTPEFLPSPQSPSLLSSATDHSLRKRSIFDHSCTGVFDRELIGRLNRVCDDCYNVFRDADVATGCRYCFAYTQREGRSVHRRKPWGQLESEGLVG